MKILFIIYFVGFYLAGFSGAKRKAQGKVGLVFLVEVSYKPYLIKPEEIHPCNMFPFLMGMTIYGVNWSGGFKLCEDFENSIIDVTPLKVEKVSAIETELGGEFELTSPVMPGTSLLVLVDKETPQGRVLAFTMELPDMCEQVPEEDKPWSGFFDAMELEERKCPLPARKYPLQPFKLSLSSASDFFNYENVGEYVATVKMSHKKDEDDAVEELVTCYTFGFSIDETREETED